MAKYENFFETVKEAEMRLLNTVVTYEGHPFYVLAITDHKGDGVFRMYLDDLLQENGPTFRRIHVPHDHVYDPSASHIDPSYGKTKGQVMDEFLDKNPDCGIIRKMMNSPAFGKFRPFPLGMVNTQGRVLYLERSPTRSTLQGLSDNMISQSQVSVTPQTGLGRGGLRVTLWSKEMAECVVGNYPSPDECLKAMLDPRVANESVAFCRDFALLRGPLDMLFLAYKADVVGILPDHDFSVVSVGKSFKHCKEVIEELGLFGQVKIKS